MGRCEAEIGAGAKGGGGSVEGPRKARKEISTNYDSPWFSGVCGGNPNPQGALWGTPLNTHQFGYCGEMGNRFTSGNCVSSYTRSKHPLGPAPQHSEVDGAISMGLLLGLGRGYGARLPLAAGTSCPCVCRLSTSLVAPLGWTGTSVTQAHSVKRAAISEHWCLGCDNRAGPSARTVLGRTHQRPSPPLAHALDNCLLPRAQHWCRHWGSSRQNAALSKGGARPHPRRVGGGACEPRSAFLRALPRSLS